MAAAMAPTQILSFNGAALEEATSKVKNQLNILGCNANDMSPVEVRANAVALRIINAFVERHVPEITRDLHNHFSKWMAARRPTEPKDEDVEVQEMEAALKQHISGQINTILPQVTKAFTSLGDTNATDQAFALLYGTESVISRIVRDDLLKQLAATIGLAIKDRELPTA